MWEIILQISLNQSELHLAFDWIFCGLFELGKISLENNAKSRIFSLGVIFRAHGGLGN